MTLSTAGAVATQSLGTVSNQISVVSRNISGANSPGVNAKTALLVTSDNGAAEVAGVGRAANSALFRSLLVANAAQGAAATLSNGLDQIDRFLNISTSSAIDVSNNRSPAAFITQLTGALQAYSASPTNETSAQLALSAAQEVVASLNDATIATQQLRQQADAQIATSVADVNEILAKFQTVNREIVLGSASGADIADALDRRDILLTQLSQQIGITTVTRPNNDMVIYTDSGVTLFETTPRAVTFQTTATLAPGVAGTAIDIDGVRVTGSPASALALRSGALYGLTQLRDVAAPQFQDQLDEIARGLIVAFAETDQTGGGAPALPGLFTYAGAGATPGPALIPGLAGQIVVNANVDPAYGGVLTRLRDGGISNPGNPAYVYNASGGAGYAGRLIELANASGAPQAFDPAAGLGASGSLNGFSADSIGWLAAQRQQAGKATSYQDAMVTQTTQALSNATGVNLDDQMSQMLALENSYQASAKLLETINALFSTLFNAIRA